MPLDDAKELFIATLGICDRASLKAYFGTQPHRSIQNIHRMARYQSGCVSMKSIELMRKIEHVAGYFELLRIAIIERTGTAWFFTLNESGVVSEFENKSVKDDVVKSILKISLSPVCKDEQHEQPLSIRVDGGRGEREGGECIGVERDILWTSENPETAKPEIPLLMVATPVEQIRRNFKTEEISKMAKKCVSCGKIDTSNPYRIFCPKGAGERSKNDSCIVEAV
jgi:hypothetical protein